MCICVVLVALSVLTPQFYFIPQAALSAVIFIALQSLVNFPDLWEVWKHNKKDFLVMIVTLLITFCFETSYGLATGIILSILFFLGDMAFSFNTRPYIHSTPEETGNLGVELVRLQGDLTFLQGARVKDFIVSLVLKEAQEVGSAATRSENLRLQVAQAFDKALKPRLMAALNKTIPKAIVVDMVQVRVTDVTGLAALSEVMMDVRRAGVLIALINMTPEVQKSVDKFGIKSDTSSADVPFGEYIQTAPDGRLYVTVRSVENGEAKDSRGPDDVEDMRYTDASPLFGGDRKKPHPETVGSTNASNFSVPSLYPPLSLDGASVLPISSLDDHSPPKGEKSI